jgi:hypothetical protein
VLFNISKRIANPRDWFANTRDSAFTIYVSRSNGAGTMCELSFHLPHFEKKHCCIKWLTLQGGFKNGKTSK